MSSVCLSRVGYGTKYCAYEWKVQKLQLIKNRIKVTKLRGNHQQGGQASLFGHLKRKGEGGDKKKVEGGRMDVGRGRGVLGRRWFVIKSKDETGINHRKCLKTYIEGGEGW